MHSLRARLVAGLLALAALGLLVLAAVTYVEQRSFLIDRVDQQLHAAIRPVSAALDFGLRVPPPGDRDRPGAPGFGGGGPGFGLPEGTYGEHRTASGTVDSTTV